jgi:hypothetical protein
MVKGEMKAVIKEEMRVVEIKMVTRKAEEIQMVVPISNLTQIPAKLERQMKKLRPLKKLNLNPLRHYLVGRKHLIHWERMHRLSPLLRRDARTALFRVRF